MHPTVQYKRSVGSIANMAFAGIQADIPGSVGFSNSECRYENERTGSQLFLVEGLIDFDAIDMLSSVES